MHNPPFTGSARVAVVPPADGGGDDAEAVSLRAVAPVIAREAAAIARELGAPVALAASASEGEARWLIGPAARNAQLAAEVAALGLGRTGGPYLYLDRGRRLLLADAPTAAGVWETFSLLRSLARFEGGVLPVADCASVGEAVALVRAEVGDCYPSFALRGIDWDEVCARHARRALAAADPVPALQSWLAELQDTHTWVRPARPFGHVPYEAAVTPDMRAVLTRVPEDTVGWAAGARPGHELLGEDAAGWWARTAATPHARALVAGRRLLVAGEGGTRHFAARASGGRVVEWSEPVEASPGGAPASWRRLPSGAGYIAVHRWADVEVLEAIADEALGALRGAPGLVVDLRGNGGGDLAAAARFRDRFVREKTVMGSIRYSVSRGVLSDPEDIVAEPAARGRWDGPVRFLTDPLTYSSSEDALLGLQGLPHVEIVGAPSGGGSGRMRTLRLLPGFVLTVSTALTYDRSGRCVEGAGIPVDRVVEGDPLAGTDPVLEAAGPRW